MLPWVVQFHEVDGPSTLGGRITVTANRISTGGMRRKVQFVKSNLMTAAVECAMKKRRLEALFPKRQATAREADAKRKRETTPGDEAVEARRAKKAVPWCVDMDESDHTRPSTHQPVVAPLAALPQSGLAETFNKRFSCRDIDSTSGPRALIYRVCVSPLVLH